MLLLSSADIFKVNIFKKFIKIISVSNRLDPDQDQHIVSPELASNYLERLSADD